MSTIITAVSDVTGLVSTVFTLMTGNPLCLFFLAASLVPVGFGIFKMARKSAGGSRH